MSMTLHTCAEKIAEFSQSEKKIPVERAPMLVQPGPTL